MAQVTQTKNHQRLLKHLYTMYKDYCQTGHPNQESPEITETRVINWHNMTDESHPNQESPEITETLTFQIWGNGLAESPKPRITRDY